MNWQMSDGSKGKCTKDNGTQEHKMHLSLNKLFKYDVYALDGDIGHIKDILFDDRQWTLRYLNVDTQRWKPLSKKVLISPISVQTFDFEHEQLTLSLSKQDVLDSPTVEMHKPVSQQFEEVYFDFFGYGYYWNGSGLWGDFQTPSSLATRPAIKDKPKDYAEQPSNDRHLRSIHELKHYDVVETDGMKGHVHDFIVDSDAWTIKYLVIDTRNWLPGGRKALLPPQYLEEVSWKDQAVFCRLEIGQIKQLPAFDAERLNDEAYLASVHAAFK
jgi:sporulation protein YlmC with PRC-barrel domain